MSTKNFQSFKNYLTVADLNKQNLSLYCCINNYCFRKMIGLVSHDKNSFLPNESKIIQNTLKEYKIEAQGFNVPPITKEQFCEFLERFYSTCNFGSTEVNVFEMCKDITEVLSVYGPYDDLAKQRMEFFNNKITLLEKANPTIKIIPNQNQNTEPSAPAQTQKQIIPNEESELANRLMTASVVSHIEEIKTQSSDYIPKRVNKAIHLPVVKSSAEYKKVKEEIIANIEDGICELEYFNIDHAKEYVESALYYLKNIKY